MNKWNDIFGDFFWRSLQALGKQGVSILLVFLSATLLSPEDFGYLTYLFSFALLLTTLSDFGISIAVTKGVSERRSLSLSYRKLVSSFSSLLFFLSVVFSGITLVVLVFFFPKDLFFLSCFLPLLFFAPQTSLLEGVFRGESHFSSPAVITLGTGCLALLSAGFLIPMLGLFGAIFAYNVQFLLLFCGLFLLRRREKIPLFHIPSHTFLKNFFKNTELMPMFTSSFCIGLANVAYVLNATVDIFFLRQFGFLEAIGQYELITKLFLLFFKPSLLLGQVLSPRVSQLVVQGNLSRARQKMAYIFPLFFLLFAFVAILLFLFVPVVFQSFFPEYVTASFSVIFLILLLLLPIRAWGVFFTNAFLVPAGYEKLLLWGAILSVMINFFFDSILVVSFGFLGIFLSTFVVYFLSVIIQTLWGFFGKIHQPSVRNAVPHE